MAAISFDKRMVNVINATEAQHDCPLSSNHKFKLYNLEYNFLPGDTYFRDLFCVKNVKTKYHADNEILANHMYLMLGIRCCQGYRLMGQNEEQLRILFPDLTANRCYLVGYRVNYNLRPVLNVKHAWQAPDLINGMVADCFLANWDGGKIGPRANLLHAQGGVTRINFAGALLYRAMGAPKRAAFGSEVAELGTVRKQKIYSLVQDEQVIQQLETLLDVFTEDAIRHLVDVYGLGKWKLAEKLIARRTNLSEVLENFTFH